MTTTPTRDLGKSHHHRWGITNICQTSSYWYWKLFWIWWSIFAPTIVVCDLLNWGWLEPGSPGRKWRTHYNFICEPGREETVGGALIGIGASQKISFVQVEEQFKGLITFDAIGAIHTLPDVSLMRPFQPPAPFGGLTSRNWIFCNKSNFPIYNFQNAPEIPREWFSKWISRNDVKKLVSKNDSVNSLEFDGTEANFARMENQITQTYHC